VSKASLYYFKLVVRDSVELARFYCDVFGVREVRRYDALATDDPHLEIFLSAGPEEDAHQLALMHYVNRPAPTPGEAAIAFMVEDVDAVVAAAQAAGGASLRAAETLEEHKFRYAIIADPEGHNIEVMQNLA
jgi:lactoylglutathione lyase